MIRTFAFAMTSVAIASLLSGCGDRDAVDGSSELKAAGATAVPIQLASWDETLNLVAQHKGKVVVLDIWSTWCGPCVQEFPNLVKLHQKYPERVVCMSLNCNYTGLKDEPPEHARPEIEKFLQGQGATFPNIICTDTDEALFTKLELGSIPAVLVFDSDGQLHKRFDNDSEEYGAEGFSYDKHIVPLVEQLLQR